MNKSVVPENGGWKMKYLRQMAFVLLFLLGVTACFPVFADEDGNSGEQNGSCENGVCQVHDGQ